jgi:hypothetical protein
MSHFQPKKSETGAVHTCTAVFPSHVDAWGSLKEYVDSQDFSVVSNVQDSTHGTDHGVDLRFVNVQSRIERVLGLCQLNSHNHM